MQVQDEVGEEGRRNQLRFKELMMRSGEREKRRQEEELAKRRAREEQERVEEQKEEHQEEFATVALMVQGRRLECSSK